MSATVSVGRPGPLSITAIACGSTCTSISGAMPASSQASSPLSTSSLSRTSGHVSGSCPVCAVSSFRLQNSSRRLVRKVVRSRVATAAITRAPAPRIARPREEDLAAYVDRSGARQSGCGSPPRVGLGQRRDRVAAQEKDQAQCPGCGGMAPGGDSRTAPMSASRARLPAAPSARESARHRPGEQDGGQDRRRCGDAAGVAVRRRPALSTTSGARPRVVVPRCERRHQRLLGGLLERHGSGVERCVAKQWQVRRNRGRSAQRRTGDRRSDGSWRGMR